MTRLRLINPPYRREFVCWPRHREERARRPGVDFGRRTPEERRAAVDAANCAKPGAVRVDFSKGYADITDDRLTKFLIDSGFCAVVPVPASAA